MGVRVGIIEQSGVGGVWRYAWTVAAELLAAGCDVRVVTSRTAARAEPAEVSTSVERRLSWRDGGGALAAARSYLANERVCRALVHDDLQRVWLVNEQLSGMVRGGNVIEVIHDPAPRPVLGSRFVAQGLRLWRLRHGPRCLQHGPDFALVPGLLTWPLPVGPATCGVSMSIPIDDVFSGRDRDGGVDSRLRILCFGRAARPESQAVLTTWCRGLPEEMRRRLVVYIGHPRAMAVGDEIGVLGVASRVLARRILDSELDGFLAQVDAVVLPYASALGSASGVLALAAYHRKPVIVSESVDVSLIAVPPPAVHRGSSGLKRFIEMAPAAPTPGGSGSPRWDATEWGVRAADLLSASAEGIAGCE